MKYKCVNCGRIGYITEGVYYLNLGKIEEPTCSPECFIEMRDKLVKIDMERVNKLKKQKPRKEVVYL